MTKPQGYKVLLMLILAIVKIEVVEAQPTFIFHQNKFRRVREARINCHHQIDSLFKNIGIRYPPKKILIAIFKDIQILELWAIDDATDTFKLVKSYPYTAYSGQLGPKRRRGDMQIPEGFYHITQFNPQSIFHLSLGINYPNKSDRIFGHKQDLGSGVYIHSSSVTIGCIPIGDTGIEELYTVCVDARSSGQDKIPVYIFPCRIDRQGMDRLKEIANGDTNLSSFWQNLAIGYDFFEKNHKELHFKIDNSGKYIFLNLMPSRINYYPWFPSNDKKNSLQNRITVPPGYIRIACPEGSYGNWLQNLPLKEGRPPVYLYNGLEKHNQKFHYAVIDIDVGVEDLQQCADAIIRLYAEYLYSRHDYDRIKFMITSSESIPFRKWASGFRPIIRGNQIQWFFRAQNDSSYSTFVNYLKFIFNYAGTYSLSRQLHRINDPQSIEIGDIFIQGGFPGHAILAIDMAKDSITNGKILLLCQSFMPAQDIHILNNLKDTILSPWYKLDFDDTLFTPEWIFTAKDLKRF